MGPLLEKMREAVLPSHSYFIRREAVIAPLVFLHLTGMQARSRDSLVLTLAAAAASLDAWSYFGLGKVFVANMTGNTVLLGFSLASGAWSRVESSAMSLLAYAVGVFAGALAARPIRRVMASHQPDGEQPQPWPGRLTAILAGECAIVVAATALFLLFTPAEGSEGARLLIVAVAFSVGLQSAAMNAMKLPGIVTTYITGTWTTLFAGLAQLLDGEKKGRGKKVWEERLALQAAALAAYCGAAVISGFLYRTSGRVWVGCLPACLLVLVVIGALLARP